MWLLLKSVMTWYGAPWIPLLSLNQFRGTTGPGAQGHRDALHLDSKALGDLRQKNIRPNVMDGVKPSTPIYCHGDGENSQ